MGVENIIFKLVGVSPNEVGTEAALEDQRKLFGEAKESIWIVNTEIPEIADLREAVKRGCGVEVIVGPVRHLGSLLTLALSGISGYELEQPPAKHFAVVDGKHVRLEERHAPGQKANQYVVRNFKNAPDYRCEFASLKDQANLVFEAITELAFSNLSSPSE